MDPNTFKLMMAASIKGGNYWIGVLSDPTNTYDRTNIFSCKKNSAGSLAFAFSPREITPNRNRAGYFFVDEGGNITLQNLETQTNNSFFNTVGFDSSNNIYLGGNRQDSVNTASNRPYLVKYSSAGVKQLERTINSFNNFNSFTGLSNHVTDPSGNSYISQYASADSNQPIIYVSKIDTSGTLIWTRQAGGLNQINTQDFRHVVALDNSQDPFHSCQRQASGNGEITNKYNASNGNRLFGIQARNDPPLTSTSSSYATGLSFDSGNNSYFAGHLRDNTTQPSGFPTGSRFAHATLRKFNTSGALQWQIRLGNVVSSFSLATQQFRDPKIVIDQSDNSVYFVGNSSEAQGAVFAKFDSSGTLLFQKRLTNSTTTLNFNDIEIDDNGDIVICGVLGGANGTGFISKLPPDGSGDGTYGNFVYENANLPTSTTSFSFDNDTSASARTTSVTTRTDTSVTPNFNSTITKV